MPKSKPSAEPPAEKLPEFFLDRCLGRGVARLLRDFGWNIHTVGELFPDDGQHTPDEEWIAYGLSRSWGLLTQDKRIRYRASELGSLARGGSVMFCLNSGNLLIRQRAAWFDASRPEICRAARDGVAAFYVVHECSIVKKWP